MDIDRESNLHVVSGLVVEKLRVVDRRILVTVTLVHRVSDLKLSQPFHETQDIHLQSTKCKDGHQSPLLINWQFRLPNRILRQKYNDDISGDGIPGIGIPVYRKGDASPGNTPVPGSRNWSALEDGRRSCGNHVGDDDREESVARDAEPSLDEDSEEQKDDGGLGEIDCQLVKDLGDIEELSG